MNAVHERLPLRLIAVAVLLSLTAATPGYAAGASAVSPEAKELRSKITRLQKSVTTDDFPAARAAADELLNLGDPGKAALADSLKQVFPRDRTRIEAAAKTTGDAAQLKPVETELAALRQQAAANLAKLDKGDPLKTAEAQYDKLNAAWAKLQPFYAARAAVLDGLARRTEWKAVWARAAPAGAKPPFDPAAEAQLKALADKALGAPAAQALRDAGGGEPADPALQAVSSFRFARQVEAYNRSLALSNGLADGAELEASRLVNHYRELLGLRPLELDARLTQAARRHAREMAEMKYFGHDSPAADHRDAAARAKAAGYTVEGVAEDLAVGPSSEAAFWYAFNTPESHRAWVDPRYSALGVGKWNKKWVATLGAAPRLMSASESDRAAASVRGESLPPQSAPAVAAKRPANAPGQGGQPSPQDDPRLIKPRLPGGGGVPSIPGLGGVPGL